MRNRVVVNEKMSMLALFMAVVMMLANCVAFATEPAVDETPAPEELPWHLFETPYMVLQFPKEGSECLVHEGIPFGNEYAEAFYIQMNDAMVPLFRLDFGNAVDGDRLGWLKTEEGNVTVTLTVFPVIEEDFAALGEGSEENYGMLMMGLNHMLQAIFEDENFTMEEPGGVTKAELLFGAVMLPQQMSWTETQENGAYQAIFYCNVQGETVALYTLRIDEEAAGTALGYYPLDGVKKPVSVETYSLQAYDWAEEDKTQAYQMMESINDVIQAMEASEQFSLEK